MRISAAETVAMSENRSPWRRARALGTTHRRGEEARRMTLGTSRIRSVNMKVSDDVACDFVTLV